MAGMPRTFGHVEKYEMDKNGWNVGEAKQQFSELLRRSEHQPQLIYRRNRLIAAVVAMDEAKASTMASPVTLADRFEEVRALARREKVQLRIPSRRSRRNHFERTLDELADGHERSE